MNKTIAAILVGVCLTITVIAVLRYNDKSSELSTFIREYNKFQSAAEKTTVYADSLKTAAEKWMNSANAKDTSIVKLKDKAAVISVANKKLATKIDSLKQAAVSITDTSALIENKNQTITLLTKQVYNDSIIIVTKDSIIAVKDIQLTQIRASANLYRVRGDSLQKILNIRPITPKNPDKLLNFIPLPSRVTSLLLGVGAGVFIGTKL